MEKVIGPTISENSFKYDSTNKRLEAIITDNLSGVKDVLFTTKQTVDETDWSTASQYFEKDANSDKYYSINTSFKAGIWYCFFNDFAINLGNCNNTYTLKSSNGCFSTSMSYSSQGTQGSGQDVCAYMDHSFNGTKYGFRAYCRTCGGSATSNFCGQHNKEPYITARFNKLY